MRSSPSLRPNWFFGVLLVAALVFVAAGRLRGHYIAPPDARTDK